jgi:3D (Asp-Asp-Asp) domain-containing protein
MLDYTLGLCLLTVVSVYVPSLGGINCGDDCGITASGAPPGSGIAACGPGWALGTLLYVPEHGWVVCGDRFGEPPETFAVDLFAPDMRTARQWGYREHYPVCRGVEVSMTNAPSGRHYAQ